MRSISSITSATADRKAKERIEDEDEEGTLTSDRLPFHVATAFSSPFRTEPHIAAPRNTVVFPGTLLDSIQQPQRNDMPEVGVCSILHVEDDPDDAFLFQRAFSRATIPCQLYRVNSAADARCYLLAQEPFSDRERFPLPDLILSNINLHDESALAFIQWLRDQPSLSNIAVACLTGTEDPQKLGPFTALGVSIIRKTSLFNDALAVIRKLVLP